MICEKICDFAMKQRFSIKLYYFFLCHPFHVVEKDILECALPKTLGWVFQTSGLMFVWILLL